MYVCNSVIEEWEVAHLNTVFRANVYTQQCIEPLLQKKYKCHESSATEGMQNKQKKKFVHHMSEEFQKKIDRVCKSIESVLVQTG